MKIVQNRTILDLSRIIAGPYATMILADFGCRVIKIQAPDGDPTRAWGPPWSKDQAAYFLSINRNKQSLCLNLKSQKCRDALYRIVAKSHAVVENFVPGVTQRLKVDYETLKKYNPALVYCSVSGFGDIGAKKNYPAFDNLIQAQTGFMHLTGQGQSHPYKLGFAIVDVVTSLYASNAILAGLLHQQQTGKGIHLKTSLYECAVAALINQGSNYLNGGVNPNRIGNRHPNLVPYGLFRTKTLPIIICVGTPRQYESLLEALHIPVEERFATNAQRVSLRKQFEEIVNNALADYTVQEVQSLMQQNKIPCGKVNDLQSLFASQTAKDLELVQEADGFKFVRSPIRTTECSLAEITAPPSLNQQGESILKQFGLSEAEISQIQKENQVG